MDSAVLQWIIASEFEKNVGVMQAKKKLAGKPMHSMDLRFYLAPFHECESGFRQLDLRIFAFQNYVTVLIRELWRVLPRGRTDSIVGQSEWHLVVHHDCWVDVLSDIFRAYDDRIVMIETLFSISWYTAHELTEEEHKEIRELISDRDHGDMLKHFNGEDCVLPIKEPTKEKHNA